MQKKKLYSTPKCIRLGNLIDKTLGGTGSKNDGGNVWTKS